MSGKRETQFHIPHSTYQREVHLLFCLLKKNPVSQKYINVLGVVQQPLPTNSSFLYQFVLKKPKCDCFFFSLGVNLVYYFENNLLLIFPFIVTCGNLTYSTASSSCDLNGHMLGPYATLQSFSFIQNVSSARIWTNQDLLPTSRNSSLPYLSQSRWRCLYTSSFLFNSLSNGPSSSADLSRAL